LFEFTRSPSQAAATARRFRRRAETGGRIRPTWGLFRSPQPRGVTSRCPRRSACA